MSTCSDEMSDKECPLCMETLELDDINFYPCKCEYQICRFCWHRIRTDENGLCPACRQPYPEDPVNFKPMTSDDVRKHKDEQRQKKQAEKTKLSDARQHLCNYRVLQKNLVYVVGLSPRVSDPEILKKNEYFGRYGKIQKIVTSEKASLPAPHLPPSHTAYVTYKRVDDALRAIIGVHNSMLDGRLVKASLGTTKYCSSFLTSRKCFKPVGECMYLHENAEPEISFTKEDMHLGKHTEYEKRLIDALSSKAPPPQSSLASQLDKILAPAVNTHSSPVRRPQSEVPSADVERTGSATHNSTEELDDDRDSTNTSNSIDDPAPSNPADETISNKRSNATARERQWSERDEASVAPSNTPPTDPEGNENEFEEDINRGDVNDLMSRLDVNEDRLDRTSLSEHDYLHSGIPAPAVHQEAPAPLMQWGALLGFSSADTAIDPPSLFPTFNVESFNSQSLFGTQTSNTITNTNSFRREPSPPPGLGKFSSDDDLGFDPFTESSKGLTALLREEQEQVPPRHQPGNTNDLLRQLFGQLPEQRQPTQQFQQNYHQQQQHHHQHQQQQQQNHHHHSMQQHQENSLLHQLHAQQQHQQQQMAADMHRQQDLLYSRMQQQHQQKQYDQSLNFSSPFGNMQHHSSQQQQQQPQSANLLHELFNQQQHHQQQQQQQQQQAQQQQMYAGLNSYMYNDMMRPRVPFGMAPPPGLGAPSSNRPQMQQQPQQSHMSQQQSMGLFGMGNNMMPDQSSQQGREAQDAFKALLPNVNVRFMDESRWSQENSLRSSTVVPPPPGFSSVMNR
ncbi:unnamed protein product [Caenorhabditis nigoni]|uniref:CCR4-NOT transcription complex subunit 4 n=1 Tax=Caenorhabditis nigoni TaxID=1611254 RepID=A0A2G5U7Q5_9PELO|nr:hypothetical protein B9Z55_014857 [Caenorhabditis nigoni]